MKPTTTDLLRNLTNAEIPHEIQNLLGLGPKFSILVPQKDLPINNLFVNMEYIENVREIDSDKNDVRLTSANIISNFLNRNKITKNVYRHKNLVNKNPHILIIRADKTNKTVAIIEKWLSVNYLQADYQTYKLEKKDQTTKTQNKSNAIVKDLFENKFIEEKLKKQLTSCNYQTLWLN